LVNRDSKISELIPSFNYNLSNGRYRLAKGGYFQTMRDKDSLHDFKFFNPKIRGWSV
jgi:hypothetical protein